MWESYASHPFTVSQRAGGSSCTDFTQRTAARADGGA